MDRGRRRARDAGRPPSPSGEIDCCEQLGMHPGVRRVDALRRGEDRVLVANDARRIRVRPTAVRVIAGETQTSTARPCGIGRDVT